MFGGASFVEVAPENSLLDCSGLGAIDGGPRASRPVMPLRTSGVRRWRYDWTPGPASSTV